MTTTAGDRDFLGSPKRTYGDVKVKRTESLPKHSLFGTTLERLSEDDKRQLQELDINKFHSDIEKERRLKESRYKLTLPDHLQGRISDETLQLSKQELYKQAEEAEKALKTIDILEEKSRYFALGISERKLPSSSRQQRESEWRMQKETQFQRDKGNLPLGGAPRYHSNSHQHVPPRQSNRRGEDTVRYGMDFPFSMPSSGKQPYFRVEHVGPPDRLPREFYMKKDPTDGDDSCAVKLPPNIKHHFGTKICQQVLSDPEKVNRTLEDQRRQKEALLKISELRPRKITLDDDLDPEYRSLGAALRQDFFPGQTMNHKQSQMKSVYTEDVYKNRVPDPDEFRYHRDDLSTWAEQNVLRDRVKKAWDVYLQETLAKK